MIITSAQNVLIKQAQSLRESRERKAQGMTIIDGAREISRALKAGITLEKVFYIKGQQEILLKALEAHKVEIIEVSDRVFEKLAYGERHEGVVALARTRFPVFRDLKLSSQPLLVVLESLEKPGNLGAVLRTCDAVGVEGVFVCDSQTDVYNPNVIRSSTGVVFEIPVICATAQEIHSFLKAKKIKICASTPGAVKAYTQVPFRDPWALVFGSEYAGLSDFWLQAADMTVKIPMKGMADSLNVSTSAAIVLYEVLRQRQK